MPDDGRLKALSVMVLLCSLQILAKAGGTALLLITNKQWLAAYIIIDYALLFAYKLWRRDLWNFLPVANTAVSVFVSIIWKAIDVRAHPGL